MNKLILEELNKVKNCELPDNFKDLSQFVILKKDKSVQSVIQGQSYLIELEDYIINPSENFTLHINWNHGIIPKYKVLKVFIIQDMGKMAKVSGNSIEDISYSWEGWLPKKSFKILQRL